MAKTRKPIPKTQEQISNEQITPFDPSGNPNNAVPNPKNRALQTSFKGDDVKPFSVGIEDIDESIFYYFKEVIKPSVIQNGERLPVPIIYGSPEKWKSFQKDGYYRDQNGKIMAPLIMFKRTDISKNRSIANKLDANNPNNFGVFNKKYSPQNSYDNFKVLNNRAPQQEYYAVVMPDYLTVTYTCIVFTYYIEQLNKIVEAIEYTSDAYWGDPQRYQFKAAIDSFGFQNELTEDGERIVRSTFDIKINGYIIPEILQKDVTALKKFSNKTKVLLSVETSDNPAIFEGNVVGDRIVSKTGTHDSRTVTTINGGQSSGGGGGGGQSVDVYYNSVSVLDAVPFINFAGSVDVTPFTISGTNGVTVEVLSFPYTGSAIITGSLTVTGSILPGTPTSDLGSFTSPWQDLYLSHTSLYFVSGSNYSSLTYSSGSISGSYTGSFNGLFTGSFNGTSSNALTASYLNTLNQDLTFNGNLVLNGTASISFLNVTYESASVIYSSGSNQFGDSYNDTQTLYGSVLVPTGSILVTGSVTSTSLVAPTLTGGSFPTSSITYKTTSGAGITGADHIFKVGNNGATEAMRILNSCNVGIGTTAPDYALHIQKSVAANNLQAVVENTHTTGIANIRVINNAGIIAQFSIYGATAPAYGAQSSGDAAMYSNAAGFNMMADNANGVIKFSTGGNAEKVRIDKNGNVGIGTTAPVSRLHIGVAPTASANYGLVSLGSGAFDGATSGFFTGAAAGTLIAGNLAAGSTSDLINLQVSGSSKFKVDGVYGSIVSGGGASFQVNGGNSVVQINGAIGGRITIGPYAEYLGGDYVAAFQSNGNAAVEGNKVYLGGLGGDGVNAFLWNQGRISMGVGNTTATNTVYFKDTTLAGSGALSGSLLNLEQTWNTTGAPTAIKLNVTNTASNAASLLMNLQVDAASKFYVDKLGKTTICDGVALTSGKAIIMTVGAGSYAASIAGYQGSTLRWGFDETGNLTMNHPSASPSITGNGVLYIIGGTGGTREVAFGSNYKVTYNAAPVATANYGAFSLGSGAFDGATAGFFTGAAAGTLIAGNLASGSTSDLLNLQVAGLPNLRVYSNGNIDFKGTISSNFYLASSNRIHINEIKATSNNSALYIQGNNNAAWSSTTTPNVNIGFLSSVTQIASTSGSTAGLSVQYDITPTSGTAVVNQQQIVGIVNQTGGANGITRGLYINPTLTAAADFRAIEVVSGKSIFGGNVTISSSLNTALSGSTLKVIGSGSAQPIFTVQGSQGELFSITDSLSGSLFSVNDISGLPIMEVFSDSTTLIGDYQAPALYTTKKIASTITGSNLIYSFATSSYDGAFIDYTIKSGSNARAGNFTALWSGTSVSYSDNSSASFGTTTSMVLSGSISGSNMVLFASGSTAGWTFKGIIRSI
jgi:hypothetical protein